LELTTISNPRDKALLQLLGYLAEQALGNFVTPLVHTDTVTPLRRAANK
jgi:hypothetical protein